jgi:hypothetical protein
MRNDGSLEGAAFHLHYGSENLMEVPPVLLFSRRK